MSESFVNPIFGERAHPDVEVVDDVPAEARGTGHGEVDTVIESLAALDDLPIGEHVAVFEQAHESLRSALAGAGQNGPAAGRS